MDTLTQSYIPGIVASLIAAFIIWFIKYTTLQLMPTATLMPKQLFQYLCKDT